jgi:hypothetical protein
MSKLRIACIGSRVITDEQRQLFFDVGAYIAKQGWLVSSGNADGADAAFAAGANSVKPESVIVYLPWKKYNPHNLHPQNQVLADPKKEWMDLAAPFHHCWDQLSYGAKKMMARNYGIVYRADKTLALLNYSRPGYGGTGHGWAVSGHLGIPRLDMNDKKWEDVEIFLNETKIVHCKRDKFSEYIGRPKTNSSWRFGNPFEIGKDGNRAEVIEKFKNWLDNGETYSNVNATVSKRDWILENASSLRGKTLGCFCNFPEQDCHGRVLIERANNAALNQLQ